MHGTEVFTKEKTFSLSTIEDMVKFALRVCETKNQKTNDIEPYIDYEKGWKFTEYDKEFLVRYYEDWIKACVEEFDGYFVEEPTKTLSSIKENGVEKSKDLIQEDAREMAYAVCDDIYEYYKNDTDTLKLIENSILDVQW